MFIDKATLSQAIENLYGSAGHLLKIWFTLKHMGLSTNSPAVAVDTSNSTPSLKRLFSCGAPDGRFYVPFAHTTRYLTMKHDAARSIIQTTVQRWASSGSVVTCDPTEYLDITTDGEANLRVSPGRRYPFGLGNGESGFALHDGARVSIPIRSFAVWYGRVSDVPNDVDATTFLVDAMLRDLHISSPERELIFVDDSLRLRMQASPLSDQDVFASCQPLLDGQRQPTIEVHEETAAYYATKVKSMVSALDQPAWMRTSPDDELRELLGSGTTAVLLYGPPRTGKTRAIDAVIGRDSASRCTIQIHDGWAYDHLVEGFRPAVDGQWSWKDGPLKEAVKAGKQFIVLEEINRTAISQALGEVFSLIEDGYRGEGKGILLRSGDKFWIPEGTTFLMTMNTVDKSTEDIDDAFLGRIAAVEFPPRTEDLNAMLAAKGVPGPVREKIALLFTEVLNVYPLGHGYFAGLTGNVEGKQLVHYYKARVRPVLANYLGQLKRQELAKVDNLVDDLFARV